MNGSKVAYRYAKSLLEVAQEKSLLEEVHNDMLLVSETLSNNSEFAEYISSPVITAEDKKELGKKLFGSKIEVLSMNFLMLIADNRRENVYEKIVKRFIHLYDELRGVEIAKVISAVELDDKLLSRIRKQVANLTGKVIDIETEIDEKIIGGYILKVGDYLYDASIKNDVQKMRRAFKENLYIPKL
ncbi:MAG: ATP synthase F1 subunit delta [Flavobacteriales bacterium]|nr:ATP synthase F1 subunit delta [Flavobacteriales bacterium]